jgi:pimeloyl-ACP methyl ester carboxylesterase
MMSIIEVEKTKVKGYQVYTKTMGNNIEKPTVIFEAGYGDYSKAWANIAEEIAKFTQVLVYDRAGLGKSERSPYPRTAMVDELRK